MIELIAFDADDTLWHNEVLYQRTKERFKALLSGYGEAAWIGQRLDQIEIQNLQWYGYGIKSFALSMVETAVGLSAGQVRGDEIGAIIGFIKDMISAEIDLMGEVDDTLAKLSLRYGLMLITKGDTFEQRRKIERSGLSHYFRYIEVVADKTTQVYQELFGKYGIDPQKVLMVGNSLRSDIYPMLALGGSAVYVPYDGTWAHENVEAAAGDPEYLVIERIGQLVELIESLER